MNQRKYALIAAACAAGLAYMLYNIFQEIRYPSEDTEFVEALNRAIDTSLNDGPVLLSSIMPGEWSAICLDGESAKPTYTMKQYLKLPDDTVINTTGGYDFIVDDQWAMSFYYPQTHELKIKLFTITGKLKVVDPIYYSKDGCFSNREKIFLRLGTTKDPSSKTQCQFLDIFEQ